jgi:flagellar biosynthesis/type III secretory pathway chaperone
MNETCATMAAALRREIEEYGSLLGLFEAQQRMLFERRPERVLELSRQIETQAACLDDVRRHREQLVAAFALSSGQPARSTLRSVLGYIAQDLRPLFEALIREVNLLVHRVRHVSRHNRLLLQRALQSRQELLRTLQPERFLPTYGSRGQLETLAGGGMPTLKVAG